jgi:FKBP-type peptidyl-prolyl cis-trans isomerase FklB
MKKIMVCAIAAAVVYNSEAQVKTTTTTTKTATAKTAVKTAPTVAFKNATDSFSYAAGMSVAGSMMNAGATKLNTALFQKAMDDVYNKQKTALTEQQANMTLQEKLQEFAKAKADAQKGEGLAYLAANKKRAGVVQLPDGLQYEILTAGEANGMKPTPADTVVVDYVGTLTNGTEFDNSVKRGQPATFPLNGVIKGWTEILQLMTKGAHWKVYIPSELAYGENPPQGAPIPPNAVLVFEITLKDIKPAVKADH